MSLSTWRTVAADTVAETAVQTVMETSLYAIIIRLWRLRRVAFTEDRCLQYKEGYRKPDSDNGIVRFA